MTKHDHPFDWFNLADYAADLSPEDWATMLSVRQEWRDSLDIIYRSGVPDEHKASVWHDYLAAVSPCNLGVYPAGSDPKSTTPPPLLDITENCCSGQVPISEFEMQNLGTRILAANLSAADTVLRKDFDVWLEHQRKSSPLPLKRRGRSSANVEVTINHLSNWRQYNVLAVLDLDFCADVFGVARLTHEVLGRDFLECGRNVDSKEWGRVARAKAEEFTKCRSLLEAQIQWERQVDAGKLDRDVDQEIRFQRPTRVDEIGG
jgi:hypothetical protein